MKMKNTRTFLKSNFLEEEKNMDQPFNNKIELNELKKTLLKQIIEANELNSMLAQWCDKVKDIIDLFDVRIEFEDRIILKNWDVEKLNQLVKHLSNMIKTTSETEIAFGATTRELEYSRHQLSVLWSEHEQVQMRLKNMRKQEGEYRS